VRLTLKHAGLDPHSVTPDQRRAAWTMRPGSANGSAAAFGSIEVGATADGPAGRPQAAGRSELERLDRDHSPTGLGVIERGLARLLG